MTYNNGKIDGVLKEYFKNGKIHSEIPYINNQKQGVAKVYNEKGQLTKEVSFQNNKFHGVAKSYSQTGEILTELIFNEGIIENGFSYKNQEKIPLTEKEMAKIRMLKDVLFYDEAKK